MVESPRRDPFRGTRADWRREILKTGTLNVLFPAIRSSNFSCSSGNFAGLGNPMVQECRKKLHLRRKVGVCRPSSSAGPVTNGSTYIYS